jgi:hypothetical protein
LRTSASPPGIELVREHVPRSRFQPAVPEQRRELGAALRPDGEVVVEDDRLAVEKEARTIRRRIVEQLVDEGDEAVTKAAGRMVPLAIPVGVSDHEHPQWRRHARSVPRTSGTHKSPNAARGANPKAAPRERTLEPSSDDGAASRDESVHDHDQREHEQEVNQPAADVERESAERPQDEQTIASVKSMACILG